MYGRCPKCGSDYMNDENYEQMLCICEHEEKITKEAAAKERERCCSIIFGLCSSDNEAQLIVDRIRRGERWIVTSR